MTTDMLALHERLTGWVGRSLGGAVTVTHDAPSVDKPTDRSVGLYLYALGPASTPSKQARLLQFNASFLVTTASTDPAQATDDLAELAFAAMDEPDVSIELAPLPPAVWTAFGVAPRPAFTLVAPVRRVRDVPIAAPVRQAVLQLSPTLQPLQGVLLEANDTPLAYSRVELPALRRSTMTDAQGSFVFPAVPSDRSLRVVTKARGQSAEFTVRADLGDPAAVVLRMQLLQPQT